MNNRDIYYRIKATKGEYAGMFSTGGTMPSFKRVGKIWSQRNHVMAHMSTIRFGSEQTYISAGATIEEFEATITDDDYNVVEFVDMICEESRNKSLTAYFLHGTIPSKFTTALLCEDEVQAEARKIKWNRLKIKYSFSETENYVSTHCFGKDNYTAWISHGGYNGAPDEVKAMILLEHADSSDHIDRAIKMLNQ